MTGFEAVLIYDGDCGFCTAAATAVGQLDTVGVIPWQSAPAQAFLEAQFESPPFTLIFVDTVSNRVALGRDAARTVADRAEMPSLLATLADTQYDSIAQAIQTVSGSNRSFESVHGQYPMTDTARTQVPAVFKAAVSAVDRLDS